ncbi:MAG TPA: PIG-L deacetylase family protein [Kofleriaceae bacterium]|nr:PIG-L deacetylase family protein [Kofleriaceae bacterium]
MRLDHVRTAVAFGAHPDDVEVGAGGLVAKLVGAGARVTIQVASIPNRYDTRRAEAIAGAAQLGATLVLPQGDAETRVEDVPMHALVSRFERELDTIDPDLVIVHGACDSHWDHTVVHRAVLAALRRSRCDILAYATRLPAGAAPPVPTCIVDISTSIDRKLAAIAEHASQFPPGFAETRRDVARMLGVAHGIQFAEVYEALRIAL